MSWTDSEMRFMARALALAARGRGAVEPNPMVGAVIVRDGRIVAEGWHRRFGGPHAEVDVLEKAGDAARGAEVFVTLEPCSHFGKTPPCADALIAAGVRRVVAAMEDPFEEVSGRGLAKLRAAGIDVVTGLLEDEARRLNAPFITLRAKRRPWFLAKYAMTADGCIAAASGDSKWVSCEASRKVVHRLRGRVDGILVGIGTVLADDPLLTARPKGKRTAARIVLDAQARLPLDCALVASARDVPVIVFVTGDAQAGRVAALRAEGAEVLSLGSGERVDLVALAAELGRREMTNVLVEGGASVLGAFLEARLIDELMVFVAPRLVGSGLAPVSGWRAPSMADSLSLYDLRTRASGCDVVIEGKVCYE